MQSPEALGSSTSSPTVVYVVASARSGTTFLGNVLGELDGWVHVGELRDVWAADLPEPRQRCGCGLALPQCAHWQNIFSRLPNGAGRMLPPPAGRTIAHAFDADLADRMEDIQRRLLGTRSTRAPSGERESEDLLFYSSTMDELYRSIAIEWEATYIVDSSKLLPDALALSRFGTLHSRFVHVVRDGRGVAMSRVKSRSTLDETGRLRIPRALAAREARRWASQNADIQRQLVSTGASVLELRYEHFANDPRAALDLVERHVGAPPAQKHFVADGHVVLNQNHTTSGNRNRWKSGETHVEEDLTWKHALNERDLRLVQLAARSGLRRFGYV